MVSSQGQRNPETEDLTLARSSSVRYYIQGLPSSSVISLHREWSVNGVEGEVGISSEEKGLHTFEAEPGFTPSGMCVE